MAAIVVPSMFAAGLHFRPAWDWKHPAVRKLLVLSSWTIGFVVANQVAVVVIRVLAQRQGQGILSAYVLAFTFFVLPHGLLAVSISTTFQPELARAVKAKDRTEFIARSSLGTRLIVLFTLPAAAGMFVLREPIIGLVRRGQFDATDLANTADALAGLSLGLVGFSVYLFTLRGFYAHQDTRTPFILNVGENLLNIVFAFVLVSRWGVLGLGLAYSIAYLVSAVWALSVLAMKVGGFTARSILRGTVVPIGATAAMAVAMWFVTHNVTENTGWAGLAQVVIGGIAGITVYAAVLVVARTDETTWILARLRR